MFLMRIVFIQLYLMRTFAAEGRRRESNRSIRRMPEGIWGIRYFSGNTVAKKNQRRSRYYEPRSIAEDSEKVRQNVHVIFLRRDRSINSRAVQE